MGEQRASRVVKPGEGHMLYAAGDLYRFLAVSGDTVGRFAIWDAELAPGGGPPPHVHTREDEGFYVLEGKITFHVGDDTFVATPGTFVHAVSDQQHWFRNDTDQPARMLILIAPGGLEAMFTEFGQEVTDPSAPIPPFADEEKARLVEIAPKYGLEIRLPKEH